MRRTKFLLGAGIALSFVIFAQARPAAAYIETVTSSGAPVKWLPGFKFDLAGNPTNANGIDAASFRAAVVRALQRWQSAAGGSVRFDYWQGTDRNTFEPDSNYNGLSSIYFASNTSGSAGDPGISSNTLGLTQVWYDANTGQILESDTVLNDRDFHFTLTPTDTSGDGSGGPTGSGGQPSVFLENVITHELGHALGLSHSETLQSTMFFMESPEEAHLGCDEQVGIRALYPASDSGARGAIAGRVVSPGGSPIFGANVEAVSRRRGTVLASGLTDPSGAFRIAGLEPGDYFLMAEPYYPGAGPLPSYYGGINPGVCGGAPFGRTFLESSAGSPADVAVAAGGTASAPDLAVQCGAGYQNAAVQPLGGTQSLAQAPVVYDGGSGFGTIDRFSGYGAQYYRLQGLAGHVEIRVVSYSLYAPFAPQVTLLDSSGNDLAARGAAQVSSPVYYGDSGYKNFDALITADALGAGDYVLRVSGSSLGAPYFPGGGLSLDGVPFFLVAGSVNEAAPPLASALAFNARCLASENFAAYTSPAGAPPRYAKADQGGQVGFCGIVAAAASGSGPSDGDGGGPGPGAGAIAGWLAPWLVMLAAARLWRRPLACLG